MLAGFLAASERNILTVNVCGKRKRELGLVVPGCYRATTNRKKVAGILNTEIKKIKKRYPYFELEIEQDGIRKPLLTKQARNEINCEILLYGAFLWFLRRFLGRGGGVVY